VIARRPQEGVRAPSSSLLKATTIMLILGVTAQHHVAGYQHAHGVVLALLAIGCRSHAPPVHLHRAYICEHTQEGEGRGSQAKKRRCGATYTLYVIIILDSRPPVAQSRFWLLGTSA